MPAVDNKRIYAVIFFLVAVAGVGFVCYRVLAPFLAAIAWAVVLALAFQTPWSYLERRWPRHRSLAAALLTLVVSFGVLVPATLLGARLTNQVLTTAAEITDRLNAEEVRSVSDLVALPSVAPALNDLRVWAGLSREDFKELTTGVVAWVSAAAGAVSGKLVLAVLDALLTVVLAIFLLFFVFRDGERMAGAALDLLPTDAEGRARMSQSLRSMLTAIFRGSLLCALAQGLLGGVGWWVAGLPSPVVAGLVTAAVSLLPVGGTALVWLPGAGWAWAVGRPGSAIFMLLWGFVVTVVLVDAFLRPLLVRGADELTTLIAFLGVFGGLAAFGVLGIFIGPVALAVAVSLVEVMHDHAAPGSRPQ